MKLFFAMLLTIAGGLASRQMMLRLASILLLVLAFSSVNAQKTNCKSHYDRTLKKTIFTQVSEEPKFPGGASEQARFISQNFKLPELKSDDFLQSSVTVKLVIDNDGVITHSDIEKKAIRDSISPVELAVLQMVGKMPKWIPAKCDGQAVAAEFTFPVIICYSEEKAEPADEEHREYYEGNVRVIGSFLNGQKEGEFWYYDPRPSKDFRIGRNFRSIDSAVNYSKGKRAGKKTVYYDGGLHPYIFSIGNYTDDLPDGEFTYWHTSGQLDSTVVYKSGKRMNMQRYKTDPDIIAIDYVIENFDRDTVWRSKLAVNKPLKLQIIAVRKVGDKLIYQPLEPLGFSVKSFKYGNAGQDLLITSADFPDDAMKELHRMAQSWISFLEIIDPNGKVTVLPPKQICFRD